MVAITGPGADEACAFTTQLAALLGVWVVIRVLVLALAAQDPGPLCHNVGEVVACALSTTAPAEEERLKCYSCELNVQLFYPDSLCTCYAS